MTFVDAPSVEDLVFSVEQAESLRKTGYCQFCGKEHCHSTRFSPIFMVRRRSLASFARTPPRSGVRRYWPDEALGHNFRLSLFPGEETEVEEKASKGGGKRFSQTPEFRALTGFANSPPNKKSR
jgi:hypothetical protein